MHILSTRASLQDCHPYAGSCFEPDYATLSNPVEVTVDGMQSSATAPQQLVLSWPPSGVPSRWLADKTQNLLASSCSLDGIIHICKFDLFVDPQASTKALSRQLNFRLESFL